MRRKLARASEVRELLDLDSKARVYELARLGILPGVVRVGRQIRFDMDKVLKFIDEGGRRLAGGSKRTDSCSMSATDKEDVR